MSTTELAREFSINQKSSWLFKRKTQEAMKTGEGHPADRDSGLEDLLIGGKKAGKSSLKPISDWEIDLENAGVFRWKGNGSKADEYAISQGPFRSGIRFPGIHVVVMNLRGWLRGIHHHCSQRSVHGYLDEFFFRFDGRNSMRSLWHRLIEQYMTNPPYRYRAHAA
jgi:hypothetical protein